MEAYINGRFEGRDALVKMSKEIGDEATAHAALQRHGGNILVTVKEQQAVREAGALAGETLAQQIENECRAVLANQLQVAARDKFATDPVKVALLLGAAIRKYLTADVTLAFIGKPMRIADPVKHAQWQRERVPFIKQTKESLSAQIDSKEYQQFLGKIADKTERRRRQTLDRAWQSWIEGKRVSEPQRFDDWQTRQHVRTARVRAYNDAIIENGRLNDDVIYYQFTTQRDANVCATCQDHDLWVVRKGEDELAFRRPPLHPNCRCYMMQVTKQAAEKYGIKPTPKKDWPVEEPAEGYGGAAPAAKKALPAAMTGPQKERARVYKKRGVAAGEGPAAVRVSSRTGSMIEREHATDDATSKMLRREGQTQARRVKAQQRAQRLGQPWPPPGGLYDPGSFEADARRPKIRGVKEVAPTLTPRAPFAEGKLPPGKRGQIIAKNHLNQGPDGKWYTEGFPKPVPHADKPLSSLTENQRVARQQAEWDNYTSHKRAAKLIADGKKGATARVIQRVDEVQKRQMNELVKAEEKAPAAEKKPTAAPRAKKGDVLPGGMRAVWQCDYDKNTPTLKEWRAWAGPERTAWIKNMPDPPSSVYESAPVAQAWLGKMFPDKIWGIREVKREYLKPVLDAILDVAHKHPSAFDGAVKSVMATRLNKDLYGGASGMGEITLNSEHFTERAMGDLRKELKRDHQGGWHPTNVSADDVGTVVVHELGHALTRYWARDGIAFRQGGSIIANAFAKMAYSLHQMRLQPAPVSSSTYGQSKASEQLAEAFLEIHRAKSGTWSSAATELNEFIHFFTDEEQWSKTPAVTSDELRPLAMLPDYIQMDASGTSTFKSETPGTRGFWRQGWLSDTELRDAEAVLDLLKQNWQALLDAREQAMQSRKES